MSGEEPRHRLDPDRAAAESASQRLDPDRAAAESAAPRRANRPPPPEIDVRRYRWAIGILGLALVIAFSVYRVTSRVPATAGVPAGQRLHFFAAPLAASNLNGDANLDPPCTFAQHDPRALNVCLLVQRAPLVLAFFSPSSEDCRTQVDTLQSVGRQFRSGRVQFAAVAVRSGHAQIAALVRSHHWTVPVAYDRDGAVGGIYNVAVCPLLELARRGGKVADRLIGNHWLDQQALGAEVRERLAG